MVNYHLKVNDKELFGTRYDKDGNILYKLNNNINGKEKEYNDYEHKLKYEV